MSRILSQAGISLADMYQVDGSIAGIDELNTRELGIVHEMGATIFSERFRQTIRRRVSAATAQNTNIVLSIADLPEGINRILGVQVFADDGARITDCAVSINETPILQDFPIWVWDNGNIRQFQLQDAGATGTFELLIPEPGIVMPAFGTSGQAPIEMSTIHLRALTSGFGAGTVVLTLLVHLAFTFTGGVSARGAAVPSW